jgi:hypothetical protein
MAKIKDLCWQTDDCPNCTLKEWCEVELEMDKGKNDNLTRITTQNRAFIAHKPTRRV